MKTKPEKLHGKIGKIALALSLPVQFWLLQQIAEHPERVEQLYTGAIYNALSQVLRLLFGWVPLPVGQFVFYGLVVAVLVWIIGLLRKLLKRAISPKQFFLTFGLGAVAIWSGFFLLFNLMWGLNYYRQPIQQTLNLNTTDLTTAELDAMSARLVTLANQNRRRLSPDSANAFPYPFTHAQILAKAPNGYGPLSQKYPVLSYQQASVKKVLVPQIMSLFGISGIYFPFTGEANVNMDPPPYLLPEVVCHEMAHQVGIASEDEANFVAYLACQHHPEPAFQYSGNLMALRYSLNRLYWEDSTAYYRHVQTLNPGIICDLEANRMYWDSFENPIEVVGRAIHDLFLKTNNQPEGVRSYSRVVELLMGEYRKNGLVYMPEKKLKTILQN